MVPVNGSRAEAPEVSPIDARAEFLLLVAKMLEQARKDLRRPATCGHLESAVAWVVGRYPCGCRYAGAGPTFEEACGALFPDPHFVELARARLLKGIEVRSVRSCRERDTE